MRKYIPKEIENKWQRKWQDAKVNQVSLEEVAGPPDFELTKSSRAGRKKFYLLVEFTYPSGDLHMGHWFAFAVPDILARMKKMQGFEVFAPNGFDAFGLPAENAAIKRGIHPQDWTLENIGRMKEQFATMGAIYDWEHEVITCDPDYYKWNQWIFLKMLEKGLAYRGKAMANWCPVDQCVLANENVEDGKCWRCGTEVVQKEVEQWFLKITDYAERLLWPDEGITSGRGTTSTTSSTEKARDTRDTFEARGTFNVDWPQSVREGQNNWIGKSEGVEVAFRLETTDYGKNKAVGSSQSTVDELKVFTTRPDTLYGATFLILAPEHPMATILSTSENKKQVEDYIAKASKKSEMERKESRVKTGTFTGSYVTNPVNGKKIPVWLADYVIGSYGTGAVMGVPGSDVRDFEFAREFGFDVIKVIAKTKGDTAKIEDVDGVLEEGFIVNSEGFDGLAAPEPAKGKFMDFLEEKGWGKRRTNYHLHDWSISRQRYWGTPIPIIYCDDCGTVPVPERDLPVELPYEVDYAPKGKPPLATAEEWVNVKCPKCGKDARREVETMDTFVDSSWYFLRYLRKKNLSGPVSFFPPASARSGDDSNRDQDDQSELRAALPAGRQVGNPSRTATRKEVETEPFDKKLVKNWMPVDIYFGGAEHTLGHTLYSRFFYKFLVDIGAIFDPTSPVRLRSGLQGASEYAQKRVHHGVILGSDGARMSKSKGNVVNPDDQVKEYGADAVRMYLAFLGPYDLVAPWVPSGLGGVYRFLERVWQLGQSITSGQGTTSTTGMKKIKKARDTRDTFEARGTLSRQDLEMMHKTIKKVTEDIEAIKFNTAVAAMMEWLNYLSRKTHTAISSQQTAVSSQRSAVSKLEYEVFLKLLAPFAPHLTEELWQELRLSVLGYQLSDSGQSVGLSVSSKTDEQKTEKLKSENRQQKTDNWSIHQQPWPEYDEKLARASMVTIVVQVNGKVRERLPVEAGISQSEVEKLALASGKVTKFLGKEKPRRVIFVADRLINLVL